MGTTPPLIPVTGDPELAAHWFENLGGTGLEGLVIKRADQPYETRRAWLKVKRWQDLEGRYTRSKETRSVFQFPGPGECVGSNMAVYPTQAGG